MLVTIIQRHKVKHVTPKHTNDQYKDENKRTQLFMHALFSLNAQNRTCWILITTTVG